MSKPESRTIECDACGYSLRENRGIKAGDPCPECERGSMSANASTYDDVAGDAHALASRPAPDALSGCTLHE